MVSAPPAATALQEGSPLPRILVADDNSNIQKMVALALQGEGIEVIGVGNGEAASAKCRKSIRT